MPTREPYVPEYHDLTQLLLDYKKADANERQKMRSVAMREIKALPDVDSNEKASQAYKKLSYAKQLIIYAESLRIVENQEFFEVLSDYADIITHFKEGQYKNDEHAKFLDEYFEFKTEGTGAARQVFMRLKKPMAEYTSEIWDKFHDAQVQYLKTDKQKPWANFTKGVAYEAKYKEEQLFPLPQMFGSYNNGAVDKVSINTKTGTFRFVKVAQDGSAQLPAGGMHRLSEDELKVDFRDRDYTGPATQMLNEFLEEENGNLYQTAAAKYNELAQGPFRKELEQSLTKNGAALQAFKEAVAANENIENAKLLQLVVENIEAQIATATNDSDKKTLRELRATVQVETFKQTQMYKDAVKFILDNSEKIQIEQVNDRRRAGGKQLSTVFIMKASLEDYFTKQGIKDFTLGDDITGGKYIDLTMLDILDSNIRFSHPLIALACQERFLKNTAADDYKVGWDDTKYAAVKTHIEFDALKLQQRLNVNKVDEILTKFKQDIDKLHDGPAKRAATTLHDDLQQKKGQYLGQLVSAQDLPTLKKQSVDFISNCQKAYSSLSKDDKSALEDIGWGARVKNMLKEIANAILSSLNRLFNTSYSLYSPARTTEAGTAVHTTEESLQQLQKPEDDEPQAQPGA